MSTDGAKRPKMTSNKCCSQGDFGGLFVDFSDTFSSRLPTETYTPVMHILEPPVTTQDDNLANTTMNDNLANTTVNDLLTTTTMELDPARKSIKAFQPDVRLAVVWSSTCCCLFVGPIVCFGTHGQGRQNGLVRL